MGDTLKGRIIPSMRNLALALALAGTGTIEAKANDEGAIARGGRLYDSWFNELKLEKPQATHSAWPATNTKQKDATTWRCKNCHGWDYMGKDGAYKTGSYQTGIIGIRGKAGADVQAIEAILKDKTHDLADKLAPKDFSDLALFVSKGQGDPEAAIDRAAKSFKGGDAGKGGGYYATLCSGCHGADGAMPDEMPESLGALAARNPWETLHKVMNGQAAEPMPALRALDRQVVADVLAYVATLPKTEKPKKQ